MNNSITQVIERASGDIKAKLEITNNHLLLRVCDNGRQWSGATIYDEQLIDMLVDILDEYKIMRDKEELFPGTHAALSALTIGKEVI